jgi:hypothetical protein
LGEIEFIFDPPLVLSGTHVSLPPASATDNGYMSAADKAKLDAIDASALTFSAPLAVSGHTVSLAQSNSTTAGYLSSADWSTFNSKAAGNHTHPTATTTTAGFMSAADKAKLDGSLSLEVESSSSLQLFLASDGSNEVLSGVVRLDPAPSSARGQLGTSGAGLYVKLGTTADMAAAGNHMHPDATQSVSGFLSAEDKTKLDGLTGNGGSLTYDAPLQLDGSEVSLSIAAPLTVTSGELALPASSATQDGYMSAADKTKLDSLTGSGNVYGGGTVSGTLTLADGLAPAFTFGTSGWDIRVVDDGSGGTQLQILHEGGQVFMLESLDLTATFADNLKLSSGKGIVVNNVQVLGDQRDAIDDAATVTGTATNNGVGFSSTAQFNNFINNVNGAIAQINRLLAAVRAGTGHGLIAA